MSKLEAWSALTASGTTGKSVASTWAKALAGWHHVDGEDLHMKHATVDKPHYDGARLILAGGGRPVPLQSVLVLAPHAGG